MSTESDAVNVELASSQEQFPNLVYSDSGLGSPMSPVVPPPLESPLTRRIRKVNGSVSVFNNINPIPNNNKEDDITSSKDSNDDVDDASDCSPLSPHTEKTLETIEIQVQSNGSPIITNTADGPTTVDVEPPYRRVASKVRMIHRREQNKFESIDYDTTASLEAIRRKKEQDATFQSFCCIKISAKTGYASLSWILAIITACLTAVISYGMTMGVKYIHEFKEHIVQEGFKTSVGTAYGYSVMFWIVLTGVASSLTYWAPDASGSGIPQVKAFLNGVNVKSILSMKTFTAKVIGITACLGIGFPAGREGPMVQVGACIGAGLSRGYSKMLCGIDGERMRFYTSMDTPQHRRDFVSLGSACGVAAAFSAPIGGILFAIEEVSTFWSPHLTFRAFASACISGYVVNILLSGAELHDEGWVIFGYDGSHKFAVWEIIFFSALSVVGGLIGSTYCQINKYTMRMRKRILAGDKNKKVVEAFLIIFLIMSVFFWMPYFTNCVEKPVDQFNVNRSGIHFVSYGCSNPDEYNQLATLTLNPQERLLFQLYSRDTGGYFDVQTLLVYLVVYFFLAAITFGIAVPSGLFIPSMIIGATLGRAAGEGLRLALGSDIDPGLYALVGAASTLGGITRMTISLAAILVETTNDADMILPIMLALVISKGVADLFGESIYELVLSNMGVVLLHAEPPHNIDLQTVNDVMSADPEVLPKLASVAAINHALNVSSHSAFPVISGDLKSNPMQFCGLVTRDQLQVAKSVAASEAKYSGGLKAQLALDLVLDLRNFMTISPYVMLDTTPLKMAYRLFRTMGLRHLCVIDKSHRLVGILTRVDLAAAPQTTSLATAHHHYPAVFSCTEEVIRMRQNSVSQMLPTGGFPGGLSPHYHDI